MPLLVRRVKVTDLPALEQLEQAAARRHPGRTRWMETYRRNIEKCLSDEPEGILVAEYDGHVVGGAIVQQKGAHPVTGASHGVLLGLTVAANWRDQGVGLRLLREAEAYLKARGCASLMVRLPADAGEDAEVFRQAGFQVVAWELERPL